MAKKDYNESVKRLRELLNERENERRKWAKEKWGHTDGKFFKIGRVLVPVLSVIGLFLMVIVCLVRFANIPEINRALIDSKYGSNSYMKEDPLIYPFFAVVFILLCLLVFCSIRFIKARYDKTPTVLFITSILLSLSALLRYCADKGTFPDNSNFDGAPTYTYFEYCLFTLFVFAVLTVYALILVIIKLRDKNYFNSIVNETIVKITQDKENGDLLTEDDYAVLINEYVDNEIEKREIGKLPKKEAKKRKKELNK